MLLVEGQIFLFIYQRFELKHIKFILMNKNILNVKKRFQVWISFISFQKKIE